MKNTPRGCLTAGGAKPPRVTPYISIQLVSLCKHSISGSGARQGADSPDERGWAERASMRAGGLLLEVSARDLSPGRDNFIIRAISVQ